MSAKSIPPSARMRENLLDAFLKAAETDGWTHATLKAVADELEMSEGDMMLAAPDGLSSMLDAWADRADKHVWDTLRAGDLSNMKIRERIAFGVRTRLEYLEPQKDLAREAGYSALAPWRAGKAPEILWNAADTIWSALNDQSTDGNWYSKRLILSGVIASTLSVFLLEDDAEAAWSHLDDRIENVMQFEKLKASVKSVTDKLPDPLEVLKAFPVRGPLG